MTAALLLVAGANILFALLRLAHQLRVGVPTPWWANASAALALGAVYLWFKSEPQGRAAVAIHAIAALAAFALLVPLAYGYIFSIWWLTLIAAAMVMLAKAVAAVVWSVIVGLLLVATSVWLYAFGGISRLPSAPALETVSSLLGFGLTIVCLALSFRLVVRWQAHQLRQQGLELSASNQAKDRFLRHLGHELRTPLHGILALTDQVLSDSLPEQSQRQVVSAHTASKVLLRHLDDLFEYAAGHGNSREPLDNEPLSIRQSLRAVLDTVAEQARSKGLQMHLEVDEDVLDQRNGDPVRLAQLVLKLLSNALRFTAEGRIDVHLANWHDHPGGLLLSVRDTGIGIPDALQPLVFIAFHRAEALSHGQPSGLGLGLAIAQGLAHRMGGEIRVESRLGQGSCFCARLVMPERTDPQCSPEHNITATLPTPQRILVCDDDLVCRTLLSEGLAAAGHQVSVAEDGAQGWMLWQEQQHDVVLTDLEMPRMDGYELLRHIRQQRRATPVVAVSAGHTLRTANASIASDGFDGFLRKPFLISDALTLLGRVQASASGNR